MASKGGWVTTSIEDEVIRYKYEPHQSSKIKGMPWSYCKKCGLLFLHNQETKRCIKLGCNYEDKN